MQLAHHHTLSAVDDKGSTAGHERQFSHVDALFLRAGLVFQLEPDVERRAVGLPVTLGFQVGQLGLADLILDEIERDFLIVTGDGKDLAEDSLQAILRPLGRR